MLCVHGQAKDQILPTRIVHLPLAFNEKWTHEAIQKYMRSSRREAPYLPSNVDFVAKNNGGLLNLHSCFSLQNSSGVLCDGQEGCWAS